MATIILQGKMVIWAFSWSSIYSLEVNAETRVVPQLHGCRYNFAAWCYSVRRTNIFPKHATMDTISMHIDTRGSQSCTLKYRVDAKTSTTHPPRAPAPQYKHLTSRLLYASFQNKWTRLSVYFIRSLLDRLASYLLRVFAIAAPGEAQQSGEINSAYTQKNHDPFASTTYIPRRS